MLRISWIILFTLSFFAIKIVHNIFFASLVPKMVIQSVKVYPSDSLDQIADRLYQQKIIQHPKLFIGLAELSDFSQRLRYGEYQISYGTTLWKLLRNMAKGTGLMQHRMVIIEGWTFDDLKTALNSNQLLKKTLRHIKKRELIKILQSNDQDLEGLFFPDTYFYTWGNSDVSILKTAYQKMQTELSTKWLSRAPGLPYHNVYDALIVASLIERETANASEKPLIAGVILHRLQKQMRLQIDPTVQYGLKKSFGSILTKTDLETKTPYNTYLIHGLPPTPICMPSKTSIEAALHPIKTDYLYYVATGHGEHVFSKTYQEHLQAVQKYRRYEQTKQDMKL